MAILRYGTLRLGRSNYYASGAIQPEIVFGVNVVESHPLCGDTYKVRMDRVVGVSHIPCAYAASTTSLLDFLL